MLDNIFPGEGGRDLSDKRKIKEMVGEKPFRYLYIGWVNGGLRYKSPFFGGGEKTGQKL